MNELGAITTPDEYPHGLRCMNCDDVIPYSDAHVYKPISDDVQETWCAPCVMAEALHQRKDNT